VEGLIPVPGGNLGADLAQSSFHVSVEDGVDHLEHRRERSGGSRRGSGSRHCGDGLVQVAEQFAVAGDHS
jgi:hypothetical protein